MPENNLQTLALRYAARDLTPSELAAFEEQLATDQTARDALAEAVRLSAQAIGQEPPKPQAACRALLRARLNWDTYRGHPLYWAGLGAVAVAACAIVVVALADRASPRMATPTVRGNETAPAPREKADTEPHTEPPHAGSFVAHETPPPLCGDNRSIAEIWAELSTPEHVERTRDDEQRLRLKMQSLAHPHHVTTPHKLDSPLP